MEALSWIILAMTCFATLAFLTNFLSSTHHHHQPLKCIPGPKPWPIIGNLNLIGPLSHQSFHVLAQKYGPIMQLKLGSFPVVVVSSGEMAKHFLKTHDHVFSSRPQTAAGKYTSFNYSDILWAPYGPHWRQGRKIYLTELLSPKRLESYEYIRFEELHEFVSHLYELLGEPIMLRKHLKCFTLNIMSRIVLGKKYVSHSESKTSITTLEEFQEMLDEFALLNAVFNIGDWVPWMGFMDLQGYVKRMKALKKKLDQFHNHVFSEHKANIKSVKDFVPKDMVDLLLQLADDPNLDVKLTDDSIRGLTQDLIIGGTDTPAAILEWAMSELVKNPDQIKKATEELDRVIGRERWVEEKDFQQLPYINAIIKETMRKHSLTLLPPHLALEDCNVDGYEIRKGTRVLINLWSIGRDNSVWDSPEEFWPERFIGKEIDLKGQHFELIPFGSGRRMCPGYSLGLKMVESCLANMLHGFNWKLPGNMKHEDISMDEVFAFSTPRKFPLVVVIEPRLSLHLY